VFTRPWIKLGHRSFIFGIYISCLLAPWTLNLVFTQTHQFVRCESKDKDPAACFLDWTLHANSPSLAKRPRQDLLPFVCDPRLLPTRRRYPITSRNPNRTEPTMSVEGLLKPVPGVEPTKGGAYLWRYVPSVGAAVIFLLLFMVSFLYISWKIWKTRASFCIVFVIGCFCKSGKPIQSSRLLS
jgi:hypothetical protein